jgi:hypothetical protein
MPSGRLAEDRATTSTGVDVRPPHAAAAEVHRWQLMVMPWVGNVACKERRQRLRMSHTEAAGEQSCETSG